MALAPLIPVRLAAGGGASAMVGPEPDVVEIELSSGHRVRVTGRSARTMVRRLLRLLGGERC